MKAKMFNDTHVEGYLYQHTLEKKMSGPNSAHPGVEFITGNIEIATDDAALNIIPVHFTYITAKFGNGNADARFELFESIINGTLKTVMSDGIDKAAKLRIDSSIGLNEFYSDRTGTEELVSVKRNEGGFVHICNALNEKEETRNTFKCDMIITNVSQREADPERGTKDRLILKGFTFDFRKALLPVEFTFYNTKAAAYFESFNITENNPYFTNLWGNQISTTTVKTITVEGMFGDEVREVPQTTKDFVVTNIAKSPYLWDDESTMTKAEFVKALADRNTYLATVKQRQDEYKASRNMASTPVVNTTSNGGFNF